MAHLRTQNPFQPICNLPFQQPAYGPEYCCFYSSGAGFCGYEEESNAHGFYQWNETPVGETDKQVCTHGNKPDYPDGIATRDCGPNGWMDYDGSACISNASNELTLLLEVN